MATALVAASAGRSSWLVGVVALHLISTKGIVGVLFEVNHLWAGDRGRALLAYGSLFKSVDFPVNHSHTHFHSVIFFQSFCSMGFFSSASILIEEYEKKIEKWPKQDQLIWCTRKLTHNRRVCDMLLTRRDRVGKAAFTSEDWHCYIQAAEKETALAYMVQQIENNEPFSSWNVCFKKNDKVNYSISMNQSSESAGLTLTPIYALQRWSQNLECKQDREIYRTHHQP